MSSVPQSPQIAAGIPRATTIEFAPTVARHYVPLSATPTRRTSHNARMPSIDKRPERQNSRDTTYSRRYPDIGHSQVSLTQNPSVHQLIIDETGIEQPQAAESDLGGFPMPHKLLGMLFRRLFPRAANKLRKTLTIPTTTALSGGELGRTASVTGATKNLPEGSKPVSYLSFNAVVGRNSAFQMLTNEQLEELGGIEYRGLNALLWLVALVGISVSLYMSRLTYAMEKVPLWEPDCRICCHCSLHGHAKVG